MGAKAISEGLKDWMRVHVVEFPNETAARRHAAERTNLPGQQDVYKAVPCGDKKFCWKVVVDPRFKQ